MNCASNVRQISFLMGRFLKNPCMPTGFEPVTFLVRKEPLNIVVSQSINL